LERKEGNWGASFLKDLTDRLNPEIVVLFGQGNIEFFDNHVDPTTEYLQWASAPKQPATYRIGWSNQLEQKLVCLNANLGNPIGLSSEQLREFGEYIRSVSLSLGG
jgi:hypothetical protein